MKNWGDFTQSHLWHELLGCLFQFAHFVNEELGLSESQEAGDIGSRQLYVGTVLIHHLNTRKGLRLLDSKI